MSHPWNHALSSAKRFGGKPEDYLPIHHWFDQSKECFADFRHRALRHHAQGIYEAERVFGVTIINSEGKEVPTRIIGERHVIEDLGWIPTLADWLKYIRPQPWMCMGTDKTVNRLSLKDLLEHPGAVQAD